MASALLCTATVFADDEANLNRVLGSLNARANLPDGKSFQEIAALRLKQRKNWSQISQQLDVGITMVTKKARQADMVVDYAYNRSTNRPNSNINMLRDA